MAQSNHARVPFPPPLLFLGLFLLSVGLNLVVPITVTSPLLRQGAGVLTVVAGLAIGWWAIFCMKRAHTSPDPGQPTAALVTTGPYRITRNPIYLGLSLAMLGFSLMAGTWWGLLLMPILLLLVTRLIVRVEEAYLLSRFGKRYEDYLSRVHRWI